MIASVAVRYGGPSKAVLDMCRALAERGHDVELFTTTIDGPAELEVPADTPLERDGYTITYFTPSVPRAYKASYPLGRALLRRASEFDVVHVHSLYLFHTTAAAFSARRAGVPYVVRPHGTLDPYHRRIHAGRKRVYDLVVERRNLNRAAAIHCTSRAEQRAVDALGLRAPTVVVPLGVHAEDDVAAGDEPRTLVTFIGRLTAKKRLDVLLDAFAEVAARFPDVSLVLAGPDDDGLRAPLLERVRAHRLADRVSFPGLVGPAEKRDLLQRSAVFALPSEDENLALALLEAMAAAVPVVTTTGVAIHEEIAAADAGVVVAPTVASLADALAALLDDPARRRTLGANGRALVRSTFSWEVLAPRLEQMYAAARGR